MRGMHVLVGLLVGAAVLVDASASHANVAPRPGVQSGTWDDDIVIATVPAPNGSGPRVALRHDHRASDGVLGAGMALLPSSVMTRRSATGGVPNVDDLTASSTFRLDGKVLVEHGSPGPLLVVSGQQATPIVLEPLYRDGSRIAYQASTNTWKVENNGQTWIYGETSDAGANATKSKTTEIFIGDTSVGALPAMCSTPGCATVEWYLSKTTDADGNTVTYDYVVHDVPASLAGRFPQSKTQQHLLSRIRYAEDAGDAAEVTFSYVERSDPRMDLSSGVATISAHRLSGVTSFGHGGALFAAYTIEYEQYDPDGNGVVQTAVSKIIRGEIGGTKRKVVREYVRNHSVPTWSTATSVMDLVAGSGTSGLQREWTNDGEVIPVAAQLSGDGVSDVIVLNFEARLFAEGHRVMIATPGATEPFITADTAEAGHNRDVILAWEAKLNDVVPNSGIAYAVIDIDRDSWPDLIASGENGLELHGYNGGSGFVSAMTFPNFPECALRMGHFADVDGDGYPDFVRTAHEKLGSVGGVGGVKCPARKNARWVKNTGRWPYIEWANRQPLDMPLKDSGDAADAAPSSSVQVICQSPASLDLAGNGTAPPTLVGVPLDPFDVTTTTEEPSKSARFSDFNGDGLVDVAYSFYECWHWEGNESNATTQDCGSWRPEPGSLVSRIHYGNGDGSFTDSGVHAGRPFVHWEHALAAADSGGTDDSDGADAPVVAISAQICVRDWQPVPIMAMDLGRSGQTALMRGCPSFSMPQAGEHPDCRTGSRMSVARDRGLLNGYGLANDSLDPADFGFNRLPSRSGKLSPHAAAVSDFDGDGFVDSLSFTYDKTGKLWDATLSFSDQQTAETRVVRAKNSAGGTTNLTWGYSAAGLNDNPELPANLELLATKTGAAGTFTYRYSQGEVGPNGFQGFGNVQVANARGGIVEYGFYNDISRRSRPSFGARYRGDGTIEHVTVYLQGQRSAIGNFYYWNPIPPYDNELLRQCEYEVGHGVGNGPSQSVTVADFIDKCHAFNSLAFSEPKPVWTPADPNPTWWLEPDPELCPGSVVMPSRPSSDTTATSAQLDDCEGGTPIPILFAASTTTGIGNDLTSGTTAHPVHVFGAVDASAGSYRWPLPTGTTVPTTVPGKSVAGATSTVFRGFVTDYIYDHAAHRLDEVRNHRDTTTLADDIVVDLTWDRPLAHGDWYRLVDSLVHTPAGARLWHTTRSNFDAAHFDRAKLVTRCGKTDAACQATTFAWAPSGQVQSRGYADGSSESWTYARCGGVTSHIDAIGQTRGRVVDALCRLTATTWLDSSSAYSYDGFNRTVSTTVNPGSAIASSTTTAAYEDSPEIEIDEGFADPRVAILRDDGTLSLVYRDEWNRQTMRRTCTSSTGGGAIADIDDATCDTGTAYATVVNQWRAFSTDGRLLASAAPYEQGVDAVATSVRNHDVWGRVTTQQAPAHDTRPSWTTTFRTAGPGWATVEDPLGRKTTRKASSLNREVIVSGARQSLAVFDRLGRATSTQDSGGGVTNLFYDDFNRLERSQSGDNVDCWTGSGTGASYGPCSTGTQYTYDVRGRPIKQTDLNGVGVRIKYDLLGRLLVRTHVSSAGNTALQRFHYDDTASPREVTTTDEHGNQVSATVTAAGQTLSRSFQSPGRAKQVRDTSTYGPRGIVLSSTDADGLVSNYAHDLFGRIISASSHSADGASAFETRSFSYDGAGRLTQQVDSDGVTHANEYLYSGAIHKRLLGQRLVYQATYDDAGNARSVYSGGVLNRYTFDNFNRTTRIEGGIRRDGVGYDSWTVLGYNDRHQLRSRTVGPVEGGTATTTWSFNAWGQATRVVDPSGGVQSTEYDTAGRVRFAEDQSGYRAERRYDDRGRVVHAEIAGQDATTIDYSSGHVLGRYSGLRQVTNIDGDGGETTQWHDGLGRMVAHENADSTLRFMTYDGTKLVKETWLDASCVGTTCRGLGAVLKQKKYEYDAATRRLTSERGPATPATFAADRVPTTDYLYSSAGRTIEIRTPGETTTRSYDGDGLLATESFHGMTRSFRYTRAYPFVATERFGTSDLRVTRYTRNASGHVTNVDIAAGPRTETRAFGPYNAYGQPEETVSHVDGAEQVRHEWTYSLAGHVASRRTTSAGSAVGTTSWDRYANGVVKKIATPSGQAIEYEYGVPFDHRLQRVHDTAGHDFAVVTARNGRGQPLDVDLGAERRIFEYDAVGNQTHRETRTSGVTVSSWDGTFDAQHRLVEEQFTVDGDNWWNSYGYNGAGRLETEYRGRTNSTLTYTTDIAGNRLHTLKVDIDQSTGGSVAHETSMAYDGNRLLSVNGVNLQYDAWGAVSVDQRGYRYERQASGLVDVLDTGRSSTTIKRDASGMPVVELDPSGTHYKHWGLNPSANALEVETEDASGLTSLTYVRGQGMLLERIKQTPGGVITRMDMDEAPGGNLFTMDGDLAADTTAFGDGAAPAGKHSERFVFAGMEQLGHVPGIHMSRLRAYDPQTGRFQSPDPIDLAGGPHRYSYVGHDPVNSRDSMGLYGTPMGFGGNETFVIIDGTMMAVSPSTASMMTHHAMVHGWFEGQALLKRLKEIGPLDWSMSPGGSCPLGAVCDPGPGQQSRAATPETTTAGPDLWDPDTVTYGVGSVTVIARRRKKPLISIKPGDGTALLRSDLSESQYLAPGETAMCGGAGGIAPCGGDAPKRKKGGILSGLIRWLNSIDGNSSRRALYDPVPLIAKPMPNGGTQYLLPEEFVDVRVCSHAGCRSAPRTVNDNDRLFATQYSNGVVKTTEYVTGDGSSKNALELALANDIAGSMHQLGAGLRFVPSAANIQMHAAGVDDAVRDERLSALSTMQDAVMSTGGKGRGSASKPKWNTASPAPRSSRGEPTAPAFIPATTTATRATPRPSAARTPAASSLIPPLGTRVSPTGKAQVQRWKTRKDGVTQRYWYNVETSTR